MSKLLSLATLLVSSCALVTGASAGEFRDARGRFVVSIPDGWKSETPSNTDTITVILGVEKGGDEAGAACLAMYIDVPSTRSASQAELNSAMEGQLNKEFWTSALQTSGDKNFTVKSTGNRDKDGRRIHNVVFAGTSTSEGKEMSGTGKMEIHFVPGSMHSMMCVTETSAYSSYSPAFEQVFSSYEPGRSAVIASAAGTPSSALTIFSRASYQGQAQVLSDDTPDLAAAGLVARAGSLAVDGSEAWLVCEGRNYSGNCQMVKSGRDDGGAVVMSARCSDAGFTPQTAAATAMRRAVAAFSTLRR